jgi:hypothetical protein
LTPANRTRAIQPVRDLDETFLTPGPKERTIRPISR